MSYYVSLLRHSESDSLLLAVINFLISAELKRLPSLVEDTSCLFIVSAFLVTFTLAWLPPLIFEGIHNWRVVLLLTFVNSPHSFGILNYQKGWWAAQRGATALPRRAQPCRHCHPQGSRGTPWHHICARLLRLATRALLTCLCGSHPPLGCGELEAGGGFSIPNISA